MRKTNKERNVELDAVYDPIRGINSPIKRKPFVLEKGNAVNLPLAMFNDPFIKDILIAGSLKKFVIESSKDILDLEFSEDNYNAILLLFNKIRYKYDFEFWSATTQTIKDKETSKLIKFVINYPQRKFLARLEKMRTAGVPIRAVLLKARQWGGSTLTEFYAAWLQLVHHVNWNSCIIGAVDDQARNIRSMYIASATEYPKEMGSMTLQPYGGSSLHKQIVETGAVIYIGSAEHPEAIRSSDIKIAHFSEASSWKETASRKPKDIIQAIVSSILPLPDTMVINESTAKGIGNYFHNTWRAAELSEKGYDAIFIPWYYQPIYRKPIEDIDDFIKNLTDYDNWQWCEGATLEGINWYKNFLEREFEGDEIMMRSEFPTTAKEAFQSTGHRVFSNFITQKTVLNCTKPKFRGVLTSDADTGEGVLKNIDFREHFAAKFWMWNKPDTSIQIENRYVVSLDIGGTTKKADWSVLRVIDRYWMIEGGIPDAIATMKFHIDKDKLAWIAVRVAEYFNHALLVIESNSLVKKKNLEGEGFYTILNEIVDIYDNIYIGKTKQDAVNEGVPIRYGFNTNRYTKPMIIDCLKAAMRDSGYIERDERFVDEAECYEYKQDGTMGATDGSNDDIVMSTAIGLWVALYDMELPYIVTEHRRIYKSDIKSEASF